LRSAVTAAEAQVGFAQAPVFACRGDVDVGRNIQSVLHPAGPHAEAVAGLSWTLFYAAAAIPLLGTEANGELGPDLTHVGSRLTPPQAPE
jgi:hypothetical protein